MINSIFSGDRATENGGGAIFNTGALSVARSSFVNNSVTNIYGGGGGIASNAYLYVVNSTFSGNLANVGGGVFSSDGTLSVVNTTFSGNSARAGGGIYFGGPTDEAILKDTIIADSAGGNCGGPIVPSGTYNLVTDASCGPSTTQTSSKELRLGPLQDNGGPTKTIAPQAGSVAIDAGDPVYCAAEPMYNRDQRGEARPQGLGCDVGAVEVKPSYYPPVAKDDSYNISGGIC